MPLLLVDHAIDLHTDGQGKLERKMTESIGSNIPNEIALRVLEFGKMQQGSSLKFDSRLGFILSKGLRLLHSPLRMWRWDKWDLVLA